MTSAFYNKAQGVIIAFDVTQKSTFLALPIWLADVRKVIKECFRFYLAY